MIIKIPADIENVGGSVASQFPGNTARELVRGEVLGSKIVIPFICHKWGEDLFTLMSHGEREGELVAVAGRIAARIANTELDSAAVLNRKLLPFVPDSHVKSEPMLVLLPVANGLAAAINVRRTEIEVSINSKVKAGPNTSVDRIQPILAEAKRSEGEQ